MSTKLTLLEVLNQNTNTYLSGQQLADRLGISRNAVWKAMKKLQEQGYSIESKAATGYRLLEQTDIVTIDCLRENITRPCRYLLYDVTDSTNRVARELDAADCRETPYVIVANEQTKGRGRLGRSFYSPPKAGLYMSIAFCPSFGLDKAMLITTIAAVAVCRAIEQVTGLYPKIKWVNDIYLNGKKLCGIMTEAQSSFETGNIEKVILGIGVNCFSGSFPEELSDTATYLKNPPREFTRGQLAAAIVNEFFDAIDQTDTGPLLREYKSKCFILGERITIYDTISGSSPDENTKGVKARAIDIDKNGGLVVEYMEGLRMREMETLTTGEVSIRPW